MCVTREPVSSLLSMLLLTNTIQTVQDNEENITILPPKSVTYLVPGVQPPREAVHVVKMAAEVDEAATQNLPHTG